MACKKTQKEDYPAWTQPWAHKKADKQIFSQKNTTEYRSSYCQGQCLFGRSKKTEPTEYSKIKEMEVIF